MCINNDLKILWFVDFDINICVLLWMILKNNITEKVVVIIDLKIIIIEV